MAVAKTSSGRVIATSGGRVSIGTCGTGAGGFKAGNTCAKGGASTVPREPRLPSVGEKVKVNGATYIAEPVDGDDSFPPAVSSFEIVDGHVIYRGRNGSEGVVTGSREEVAKWMVDVRENVQRHPPESSQHRPWQAADGGEENISRADDAASSAAEAFGIERPKIEFTVSDRPLEGGEFSEGTIRVANAHLDKSPALHVKVSVTQGMHIAAHEVVHDAFSTDADAGRDAMRELKESGDSVSLYGDIAGPFEGIIELGAVYTHSPDALRSHSPTLYGIAERWAERVRVGKSNRRR
jgi:hypothetical protein